MPPMAWARAIGSICISLIIQRPKAPEVHSLTSSRGLAAKVASLVAADDTGGLNLGSSTTG
jgi:hypothetical protein